MADVIFAVAIVAFFALAVTYVKACDRIVGRDTGPEPTPDADAGADAGAGLGRAGAVR